ncbi:DUF2508 family protein [Bacillus lacus]|uniref:DUF2508 family protein n=1 Tax=Metabacillus lacus TaxID=1983721 RepID=A0A7X2J2J8_9BACI|nr:YaaL family protein [Metabacillus lacus]MRX74114.1 DUF2508 family protein [Metabacillus lacus]
MLFRRKNWLRKEFDEQLIDLLIEKKEEWARQRKLIEQSMEPSPEVMINLQTAESKYLFLLREAKRRNVTIKL